MVAAGPLFASGAAQAAGFEVTNLNDSGPGSLRQAIIDANTLAGPDVITFQAGLTGTIALSTGQLELTDSATVTGPGAASLTIDASAGTSRIFYLYNSSITPIDVVISGLTLTGGDASVGGAIADYNENLILDSMVLNANNSTGAGGALFADGAAMTLTVRNSVISGNTAVDGGGIYVEDTGGTMSIERTTISGNAASRNGGGIYLYDPDFAVTISDSTISGNTATSRGGGIYLYDTDGIEPFVIDRTTISGNSADTGAGIYLYGPDTPVIIRNTTISGNTAVSEGGGVFLDSVNSPNVVAFEHSTVAGNSAGVAGGNLTILDAVTLSHTVVADGTAPSAPDVGGTSLAFDANYSLIEDATGLTLNGTGNITGTDPALGALAANGGPTFTHRPSNSSPLVNAGDPAIVGQPATDQRGVIRIIGAAIDIGAVEIGGPPVNDAGSTAEDTPLSVFATGVLANDPAATSAVLVTAPVHGVVTVNANGGYLYTPNANFNGTDSFTYEAFEAGSSLGIATVNLTVSPVQDPPLAVNDTAAVTVGNAVTIQVLGNDSDVDGDTLTVASVTQGSKGTVTIVGGTVVYRPNLGASGTDTFTYSISDGVNSATATVTVTLTASAPVTAPIDLGTIPATGSEHGGELVLATSLVIVGGALAAATRRRRPISP